MSFLCILRMVYALVEMLVLTRDKGMYRFVVILVVGKGVYNLPVGSALRFA